MEISGGLSFLKHQIKRKNKMNEYTHEFKFENGRLDLIPDKKIEPEEV